jgi:cytochrome c peroxidase
VIRAVRALAAALLLAAAFSWARPASSDETSPAEGSREALGRAIFFDARLSEPRGTSCASCHDPARAFSGDHGSGAGVPAGSRPGVLARRTAPSLLYLRFVPRFRFFDEEDDNHAIGYTPHGGFFWDGRADTIATLVRQPLLNPREMNNRDAAQIAEKLRSAPYAEAFRRAFPGALDGDETALASLGLAIEAFLLSPSMAPFSSRFDDYVRGRAMFTAEEKRGLELFKDRRRAGCSGCHTVVDSATDPARSTFTDYGFDAVGAPRNPRVRGHEDDLGVCERTDRDNPSNDAQYCASFRTPSLRNVAVRPGLMHNGAFTRLRDAVKFYATRATNPERWYRSGVDFDDTPAAYRGQVNVTSVPYNRHRGAPPALDEGEIDAIVAFLRTLTDRRP